MCSCCSREKSGGITWLVELRRHLKSSMILSGNHETRTPDCQTSLKSYQVINSKITLLKNDLDM